MTSHRIYQQRSTALQAIEELNEHAGTQFDAELVALFCKFLEMYPQMKPINALNRNTEHFRMFAKFSAQFAYLFPFGLNDS